MHVPDRCFRMARIHVAVWCFLDRWFSLRRWSPFRIPEALRGRRIAIGGLRACRREDACHVFLLFLPEIDGGHAHQGSFSSMTGSPLGCPESIDSAGLTGFPSLPRLESRMGPTAWNTRLACLLIACLTVSLIGPLIAGDMRPLQACLFILGLYILKVTAAAIWSTRFSGRDARPDRLPFVSVLIPARNEEQVIATTIAEVAAQDYCGPNGRPGFEILAIDDASTDGTGAILSSLTTRYSQLRVLTRRAVQGGGKAAALNAALPLCRGEVIVVFDADILIARDFLRTLVSALPPAVAGVQARVRIYNRDEHFLAACQDDEFAAFHKVMQLGRDALDGAVGLGGQGQAVWAAALRRVGGWHTGASTEDLDLTVRLVLAGFRVRFCPQAVVWQEGVTSLLGLFRQRRRWAVGNLRVCFAYLWPLLGARVALRRRLDYAVYLASILTPFWLLLSYLVLNARLLFHLRPVLSLAPIYIVVSAVAYFPLLLTGLWGEVTRSPLDLLWRVVRLWGYSFLWIPIGLSAIWQTLVVRTPVWDKTAHAGLRGGERFLIGQSAVDGDG
jgi:cellulose synthase/poly-beta-1,6-N-acetylglucosamine synthase-like glycosyltransferase